MNEKMTSSVPVALKATDLLRVPECTCALFILVSPHGSCAAPQDLSVPRVEVESWLNAKEYQGVQS